MWFRLYQAIRIFYYPFFRWVFPLASSSLRERLAFEERNLWDNTCRSFKEDGLTADIAFEVSSEGELEQIRPALVAALDQGRRVELIFASDSVEKQCLLLASERGSHLRVFRYPLVGYFPRKRGFDPLSWLSAKTLYLCRYDFFPCLMRYGRRKDIRFVLLSGSLKSFESKKSNPVLRGIYRFVYRSFDQVAAATEVDAQRFLDLFDIDPAKVVVYDFRPLSINKRLRSRSATLQEKLPGHAEFLEAMSPWPLQKRIVFGSFWPLELSAFEADIDFSDVFVAVFPHRLDRESLNKIKSGLQERVAVPVYELSMDLEANREQLALFAKRPGPVVVGVKGALCESYPDFGAAFVGGGHGVSAHSLLEPFLGGCKVYCGPRVHRSSEYDLIRESNPDRVRIVDKLEDVFDSFLEDASKEMSDISGFQEKYAKKPEETLRRLGVIE